jgi:hypothetical protein
MKGTRYRGQIRSESPDTTGPDPGGSPPKAAATTHSQIRRSVCDPSRTVIVVKASNWNRHSISVVRWNWSNRSDNDNVRES